MGTLELPCHQLSGVSFSLYSTNEICKLSVKEITNPVSIDAFHHPTYGGLYDPALGSVEQSELCGTCGQGYIFCPGHMGHIMLPMPVYNPVLFDILVKILKGTCFNCYHFLAKKSLLLTLKAKLRALDFGMLALVDEIQEKYMNAMGEGGKSEAKEANAIDIVTTCLNEAIEGKDEKSSFYAANVKNVVERRQQLCKEFLGGSYWSKNCPHCSFPCRSLRTEHHTKIFFTKDFSQTSVKRYLTLKLAMSRLKKQRAASKSQDDEGDINEVVIDEHVDKTNREDLEAHVAQMGKQQYLTPMAVRRHLRQVWTVDGELLASVMRSLQVQMGELEYPTDVLFFEALPVPPSRFRPRPSMGDKKFENPQSIIYGKILTEVQNLQAVLRYMGKKADQETMETDVNDPEAMPDDVKQVQGKMPFEKLNLTWVKIQTQVNCLFDMNLDKLGTEKNPGIKQLIEKKEGLFRMNMMGKRVNYACRSVISPDPYINTNEIGIPLVFATKLTYPQPVTPWNFHELRRAVINGPKVYPGASFIETEDGKKIVLRAEDPNHREAVAKQLLTPTTNGVLGSKKVYRHLKNGDVLLLNRQPTLHRPSIQAHRARVLGNEKTLRLHYANCKAYNADFDGDEMNAHFPQDEISRAEAYTIAATDFQYLVPKDGSPLAGLIQDHMVSGVTLTLRGQFFCRADYQQLVYRAITDKAGPIKELPPSILKPQRLWSGKQVLSTVLLNIIPEGKVPLNLIGNAKVSVKNWLCAPARPWRAGGPPLSGNDMSETEVVISNGELLVGVLDKGHYGATAYGLVHSCYELYGGEVAGRLLTCLGKLFTCFLQLHGFTLGVEDILCLPEADRSRRKIMRQAASRGPKAAARAFNVDNADDLDLLRRKYEEAHYSKEGELKDMDLAMKGQTDELQNLIAGAIIPNGLLKHFPQNNLQLMVQSGAKGSSVNCMQISCLLGQIELEGRRPALMLSGKPLPSFPAYDMTPRAGGFVAGRFLTGIKPQEYFFHCMAGREGLVDTAVKTSRSGYLQRCVIKHLEGLVVNYDQTVRDSDSSIIQFHYGEDGLDMSKTQFLKRSQFPFLISNQRQVVSAAEEQELQSRGGNDSVHAMWKKLRKWKRKCPDLNTRVRLTPFLRFCQKKWQSVVADHSNAELRNGRSEAARALCAQWYQLDPAKKEKYVKHGARFPDPVLAQASATQHLGVVSENYQELVDNYINSNPDKLLRSEEEDVGRGEMSAERFRSLLYMRHMKAQVPPGEAVGLLAAQSIGEPSTQMTLNTFHFAGRGEMNVTLGIPRLREILMVASANIKTPNMDVPILDTPAAQRKARTLKRKFNKVYLSQVLEDVEVTEKLSLKGRGMNRGRLYTLRFNFLPYEMYKDDMYLTPSSILSYMERRFLSDLMLAMKRKKEEMSRASLLSTGTLQARVRRTTSQATSDAQRRDLEQDEISDDELHDGDATSAKRRERQQQGRDYQGEEEEKAEVGLDEDEQGDEDEVVEATNRESELAEDDETGSERNQATSETNFTHEAKATSKKTSTKMMPARINYVLSTVRGAVAYSYDSEDELWCEVTFMNPVTDAKLDLAPLVEAVARRSVVYHTPGIVRCFLSESKGPGQPARLKTEGVNLQELHKYKDCLDLNQLYTNNIHEVARVYGIEAASRAIIKEVRDVFAAYGIAVDYHHLSIVADYMTFEGEYKAFNRYGLNSNPSPFQKMSFETTVNFLKSAVLSGAYDDLRSPSSRLVVGRTVQGGTGCFDLLQPI